MTAQELIEALSICNPDTELLVVEANPEYDFEAEIDGATFVPSMNVLFLELKMEEEDKKDAETVEDTEELDPKAGEGRVIDADFCAVPDTSTPKKNPLSFGSAL